MRGIERLVAGALLVTAVTGTAMLARTSAPETGQPGTVRLQRPPRSSVVAPLPVVISVPEAPARRVVAHPAKHPAPAFHAAVALAKPVVVPTVRRSAPHVSPPPPAAAPAPAPTPAPSPAPTTRVVAAAETKTFGHSHPRGNAWGHVKHAVVTTLAVEEPPAPAPDVQAASADDNGNGNGNAWGHSKHAHDD